MTAPTPYGRSGRQAGETSEECSTDGEAAVSEGRAPMIYESVRAAARKADGELGALKQMVAEKIASEAPDLIMDALIQDKPASIHDSEVSPPLPDPLAQVEEIAWALMRARHVSEANIAFDRAKNCPTWTTALKEADAILAGPLADLLSRLTILEAERDETLRNLANAKANYLRVHGEKTFEALRANIAVSRALAAESRSASLEARLGEAEKALPESLREPDVDLARAVWWLIRAEESMREKWYATAAALRDALAYIDADAELTDPDHVVGTVSAVDLRTGETRTFGVAAARALLGPSPTLHDAVTREREDD